jgi:hypothetical protein
VAPLVPAHIEPERLDHPGQADVDVLLINGISSERTVALLTEHAIGFSEVSAHRADTSRRPT